VVVVVGGGGGAVVVVVVVVVVANCLGSSKRSASPVLKAATSELRRNDVLGGWSSMVRDPSPRVESTAISTIAGNSHSSTLIEERLVTRASLLG